MLGIPDASHSPSLTCLLMRVDICACMSFISAGIHVSDLSARNFALISVWHACPIVYALVCAVLYPDVHAVLHAVVNAFVYSRLGRLLAPGHYLQPLRLGRFDHISQPFSGGMVLIFIFIFGDATANYCLPIIGGGMVLVSKVSVNTLRSMET